MITTAAKKYTIEEFAALPDDGKRYELVAGNLVEKLSEDEEHNSAVGNLLGPLWFYAKQKDLGQVYGPSVGIITDSMQQTVRTPDASFIVQARVVRTQGFIPVSPDLAVDVVSPSDLWLDVDDKIEEYKQAGVRLIWVINPYLPSVHVHRIDSNKVQTLGIKDELDGEDVLPGFKLKVSALFE